MNSQLLPVIDFELIQLRRDERIADAAHRRVLRGLPNTSSGFGARQTVSNLLDWMSQHLRPSTPTRDEDEEHVLIPLAR